MNKQIILGSNYPRVTTIISETESSEKKQSLMKWMKKMEKIHGVEGSKNYRQNILDNGTDLHKAIEDYLNDKCLQKTEHPMLSTITPFLSLLKKDNHLILEKRMYCHRYKFQGKPDLICSNFQGLPTIIDWTSSLQRKRKEWLDHKFVQAGAYAIACEEIGIKIEQLVVVAICSNCSYQVFTDTPKEWRIEFLKRLGQYQKLMLENNDSLKSVKH
jgi:hypothetical protein